MTGFDIAVLIIAGIFTVIGLWKGFLKTVLKLGASVFSVLLARMLGAGLGTVLLPELISADSPLGERMSADMLDSVNRSIATVIGTVLIFIVLYIILHFLAKLLSKAIKDTFKVGLLDRLLGAVLGLIISVGIIYLMAFAVDIVAVVVSFISPDNGIYEAVEASLIFKYFF